MELLLAGGALGGAEIGALVGLLFGALVGLGVGLRQQISLPSLKVVEQGRRQPSQVTPISRSPELQLPMPHAVSYRTSPAPHEFCCSRRRACLEEVFGQIGGAASPSGGPAGRGPSSMGAGARASDRFAASAERPRKGASRQDSASALSSVEERSTASAQLESSTTRECRRVPTSVSAAQPAPVTSAVRTRVSPH